jgi:hypothetical protein
MATVTARLANRLPPQLRMAMTPFLSFAIGWLALTGLIETVQNGDSFDLVKLGALIVGCVLAAFVRPIPDRYRQSPDQQE